MEKKKKIEKIKKKKNKKYDLFLSSDSSITSEDEKKINNKKIDEEKYYVPIKDEIINNKYKIINILGKGVYGIVIKVLNLKTNKEEAIKIIRKYDQLEKSGRKEFKILKNLNKTDFLKITNIIRVNEEFTYKGYYCFTMELLENSVREIIKKTKTKPIFDIKKIRILAYKILKSLKHLKMNRLLHLDLKTDNLMMDNKGGVKLMDFNSAYYLEDLPTGELVPLFYRAPEIFLGEKYGFFTDMWSLGCVLYELFIGDFFFKGNSKNEIMERIWNFSGPFSLKYLKKLKNSFLYFDFNNLAFLKDRKNHIMNQSFKVEIKIRDRKQFDLLGLLEKYEKSKNVLKFYDLLKKMLKFDFKKRITVEDALFHDFFKGLN